LKGFADFPRFFFFSNIASEDDFSSLLGLVCMFSTEMFSITA
jgi:hypothetical protein